MDYKNVIESRYNREAWEALLHDIFLSGANFRTTPIPVDAHSPLVSESLQLGTITLKDDNKIAVYEIKLSNSVDIVENRVGIRNLLFSDWKFKGCAGAFIFCYRDNESVLRFSYVSQTFAFGEDGKMAKEETDTKRFTYILGEGHRSRTAIGQFENLKSSSQTLKDLTKAFSLDAVSDRFFDDYKEVYEDIVEYVTGKRYVKVANKWEEKVIHAPNEVLMAEFSWYEDPEKTVRDYVKRLMSRIVFLQFIQKKGWLGVPIDKEWGEGDKEFLQHLYEKYDNKDNFIDGILELLIDDINHKRENDIANFILGRDIKVPYLNGGLFERDSVDERTFSLPRTLMDKMMNFFSSYNFTIDENDPDDAEIGVDPEMLGRIFENLLEDNKDKGAFYTPKEIVQYMCQESLIAYLQKGKSDAEAEAIRTFVTSYDASALSESLKQDIDTKLRIVKICDPAIGSGAFPMGLLKELFACRSAIEGLSEDNAAEIKKHIIQNNIYGVDIEKGAVEIARLRFWLAIVVDEKTPHALPNMDFKIMQGNSLLESYKSIDLSNLTGSNLSKDVDSGSSVQLLFEFEEKDVLDEIRNNIEKYYSLTEHSQKEECRNIINQLVKDYIVSFAMGSPSVTKELAKIDIPNDLFFMWHTYFNEVFANNDNTDYNPGFDIIIGNPPYGANIDSLIPTYEKCYPATSHGYKDIYKYFYDQGLRLCRRQGVLCYITPNTFLRQPRYGDVRRLLLGNRIEQILDLGEDIFKEAVVTVAITLVRKTQESSNVKFTDITKTINSDNAEKILHNLQFNNIPQQAWHGTSNNSFIEDIHTFSSNEKALDEIMKFKDAGINYQRVKVGLSQKGKSDLSARLLYEGKREDAAHVEYWKGTDINEFFIAPSTGRFCRPNIALRPEERVILNEDYFAIKPKLIWRQTAPYPICVVDNRGVWFGRSIQAGIIKNEYIGQVSYEYLCGVLNSRYIRRLYENSVKEEGRVFPQVKLEKLKPLPIRIPEKSQLKKVEDLVVSIMKAKALYEDSSSLEERLNGLVEEIYLN